MHLSEDTPLALEKTRGKSLGRRAGAATWDTLRLGIIPRLGAVIPAEMQLVLPAATVRSGDVCSITVGARRHLKENETLPFEVHWRPGEPGAVSSRYSTLLCSTLCGVKPSEPWSDYRFSLDAVAGTVGSIVVKGARGWRLWRHPPDLVLYDLAISDEETLDLERARSFRQLRIRNERINFDAYYQHATFEPVAATPNAPAAGPSPVETPPPADIHPPPGTAAAPPPVAAVDYSHAQLYMKVRLNPPLFGSLLKAKADALHPRRASGNSSKLRVLSLCSGAARIEFDLVRHIDPELVSLTLLDVNPNLLATAARTLSSWGKVQTIVADVNEIDLRGERFDVILCVSALHHVVELEHVIRSVADSIGDTGEFWSMGETLGRNGGRMFPESYAVANEYFKHLPAKYRHNRNTNSVDRELQDLDYSIGCFEGIRCESIEPTLLRFLEPVHVSKHNCIVWKLFSLAYSDNYNIALEEDRRLVDTAVDLDVGLHRRGNYGVELHAVYRRA